MKCETINMNDDIPTSIMPIKTLNELSLCSIISGLGSGEKDMDSEIIILTLYFTFVLKL